MEPSYAHLAAAYDELFPLDPEALRLVAGDEKSSSFLDAGCGTGLLVRALADAGHRAHGFDLDPDLLAAAQARAGRGATFAPGDLRRLEAAWPDPAPPRVLTCLGNTLVHLTEDSDLDRFFAAARNTLAPGGRLVVQILNYRHLAGAFPVRLPDRQGGRWRFERWYTAGPRGLWTFHTTLTFEGVERTGAFDLRPWTEADLAQAATRAGFADLAVTGGFDGRPLEGALVLVLTATRA